MTLYIKSMVCNRCIMAVKQELERQGLEPDLVALGQVNLKEETLAPDKLKSLDEGSAALGFQRFVA